MPIIKKVGCLSSSLSKYQPNPAKISKLSNTQEIAKYDDFSFNRQSENGAGDFFVVMSVF